MRGIIDWVASWPLSSGSRSVAYGVWDFSLLRHLKLTSPLYLRYEYMGLTRDVIEVAFIMATPATEIAEWGPLYLSVNVPTNY